MACAVCDGMGRLIRLLEYSMRCCNNGADAPLVRSFCLLFDDAKKAKKNVLRQERAHLHSCFRLHIITFAGVFFSSSFSFLYFRFLWRKTGNGLREQFEILVSHAELSWLNEREDREAGRDWADKNLRIKEVEQYYEVSHRIAFNCSFSQRTWEFQFYNEFTNVTINNKVAQF